jgi:hypothetical protein
MLLSARILKDCANVNNFEYSDSCQFTKGDVVDALFQLTDLTLDTSSENFLPPGRRYMPAVGATLQCVVESIDDVKTITRPAVQPFSNDGSIWKISFLSSDVIEGTANLRLTLTEGSKVTRGVLRNAFRINSLTNC